MTDQAEGVDDRYNRVTWFDFPIPSDFYVRQRKSPVDPPFSRRRGSVPASYLCKTCGVKFVAKNRAGKLKRVNGKVYPRRFCSRGCYGRSLIGKRKDGQFQGGTSR